MAELEKVTDKTAKSVAKKKLAPKIITKLDNTPADVVQWSQEGRELIFEGDDDFLEIPSEVYKTLSFTNKRRYDIVKSHTLGNDVVSDATPEAFNLPFNVRPDAANRQLGIKGKNPKKDYHWARPEKMGQHQANGWEVDHDDRVQTEYVESCNYKTVGGQNLPELLLVSRLKTVSEEKRKEKRELRDASVKKTQHKYRQQVESTGMKPVIGTDNG